MKNNDTRSNIFRKIHAIRRRPLTLRMAPMIDVIFLLLIFFLVAAKWRPQEDFLPFRLPTAQAGQSSIGKPEPLIINISAIPNGYQVKIGAGYTVEIKTETMEQDLTLLMQKIEKTLASQKRFACDPIEIVCAPAIKWDHLAKIYNLFYGAGLSDITFRMTE